MVRFKSCIVVLLALIACATGISAAFADTLTVVKPGSGSGSVTSTGGTINCGATCSNTYTSGTVVTLTANPAASSQFTGWLGPCTGIGTCQFPINGATTVLATFASTAIGAPRLDIDGTSSCDALTDGLLVIRYLFGLSGAALINGAVGANATRTTSDQIGKYLVDVAPLLDADDNGQDDALTDGLLVIRYLFGLRDAALISGALGPGARRSTAAAIAMQIQNSCLPPTAIYTLSVGKIGTGSGTLTSSPAGLNCGAVCYKNYDGGTVVSVIPTANAGSSFSGWSGACTGNSPCSVTMDAARSVTASFTINACVAKTCTDYPSTCGPQNDGCGGLTANCGNCTAPSTCGGGGVTSKCGGPIACTPKTCSNFPNTCGPQNDGCGGLTANCGGCIAPSSCGGGGVAGQCGGGGSICTRKTCTTYSASCGSWSDGCGGTLTCGTCAAPNTCGGGGVSGQCGGGICTPKTCTTYSASCGSWSDGCGGTLTCGTCAAPSTCGSGGIPGQCN